MRVGSQKICCVAKSKLAKLLHALHQVKAGARRSKEQMTRKCEANIMDEEEQQGRQDSQELPVPPPREPHRLPQQSPLREQAEEKKGGNQEPADALGNEDKAGREERQERQGSWEPPVPPLPAPPQPPQFLSLMEHLEQVLYSQTKGVKQKYM